MSELFISLLPFILGSALLPIQIIIVILILNSPNKGVLKASAYVGGMTLMRLLQGLVFGMVLYNSELTEDEQGKSLVVLTLVTVLGILLLVTAYRQWRTEDDPDAPPPKWMAMIDNLTPLKALGFGFGLLLICGKCWVFNLGAIGEIGQAELGQTASAIAFLGFVLLAESLLLLPILISLALPKQSKNLLASVSSRLTRYNRPIVIVVSLVFGLIFLYKGLTGLLGF
jgi:hypothetical protein